MIELQSTRHVTATWLGLLTIACLFGWPAAKAVPPNIIFVMVDDMGYGDLGSYGGKEIATPRLDRMATEGLRFTQCYAGSVVCAPSRSVLMTGQHTGHTTVRGNFGKAGGVVGLGGAKGRVPLRAEDVTVAELLKKAGYTTALTGKWGLGEPNTTGHPNRQGFDEFFGYLNQRRAHTYYPTFIWRNEEKVELKGNQDGQRGEYTHDMFTDFALRFIRDQKNGPFFLYLAWTVPHGRFEIPSVEPYVGRPWSDQEKVYAAMLARVDRDMGRIFTLLKVLGIDRETVVFFCSDNGAADRYEGRFDSSGPLRGRKRDVYEGGLRTPMLVRWPGVIRPQQTSDLAWYFADVLPTLAELGGAEIPGNIDGVSVAPTLRGEKQDLSKRMLYWEYTNKTFQQAARRGDWKVVRSKRGMVLELYDLSGDVGEQSNVAAKHPEVVADFEKRIASARTPSVAWPVDGPIAPVPRPGAAR
jgi:arylsulfatase A-like enzyme